MREEVTGCVSLESLSCLVCFLYLFSSVSCLCCIKKFLHHILYFTSSLFCFFYPSSLSHLFLEEIFRVCCMYSLTTSPFSFCTSLSSETTLCITPPVALSCVLLLLNAKALNFSRFCLQRSVIRQVGEDEGKSKAQKRN